MYIQKIRFTPKITLDFMELFLFTKEAAIWGFTGIEGRNSDAKGGVDSPKTEEEKYF